MTGFWVVGTELHLPSVPPAPCTFISLSLSAVPSQLPYVCLSASWCPASLTPFEEPSLTTAASTEYFVSQLLSHWWSTPEVANNHSSFKFILKISCHHWTNKKCCQTFFNSPGLRLLVNISKISAQHAFHCGDLHPALRVAAARASPAWPNNCVCDPRLYHWSPRLSIMSCLFKWLLHVYVCLMCPS